MNTPCARSFPCQVGLYYAEVTVGQQKLHAQLDTGSSDFLAVSNLCTECQTDTKYTPGATAQLQFDQLLQYVQQIPLCIAWV